MRKLTPTSFRRRSGPILTLVAMLFAASAVSAQERNTLRKVEIVGFQRLSSDQILAATGLKVGDPIDASMVEGAAEKLMRTGWFQSVDYRVRNAEGDTIVIFEVVEKAAATNASAGQTFGQVNWSGNLALSNQELSGAFGLRSGDPAPQAKIDEGLERIRKAYARRGYIDAEISEVTRNPDTRGTNYQFAIREGRQYRMGLLTIGGLTPAETRQLQNKWMLAPGAVFDGSYSEQFRTTVLRPFVASRTQRTGARAKFEIDTKPDPQKRTADVVITFK